MIYWLAIRLTADDTNDNISTLPVNTYKTYIQQMITMIENEGKTPYLAKLPWANLDTTTIVAYNAAIDELATTNGIKVVPPDFYTHFEANYLTEMYDAIHPNGLGYQSMADLWADAIMNPLP